MTEWRVSLEDQSVSELAESIRQGAMIDESGMRMLTEETVARVRGLKMEIFSNEHPPPHFRVEYQGSTANYQISDCSRINGSGEILRYEKNIRVWWKNNKQKLIHRWNSKRPSDCPVGVYKSEVDT